MKKTFYIFLSLLFAFIIRITLVSASDDYSWIDNYCIVNYRIVSSTEKYADITSCNFSTATDLKDVVVPATMVHENETYTVNVNGPLFQLTKYIESVTFRSGSKLSNGFKLFRYSSPKRIVFENDIDTSDLTDLTQMLDNVNSLEYIDFGNLFDLEDFITLRDKMLYG